MRLYLSPHRACADKLLDDCEGVFLGPLPKARLSHAVLFGVASIASAKGDAKIIRRLKTHTAIAAKPYVRRFDRGFGVTAYTGMATNVAQMPIAAEAFGSLRFLGQFRSIASLL